ncbi:MAG: glycosyltransferase [Gemmatimonadaceae bacterium]
MSSSGAAPLRILISGHEICGLIHDLAEELKRQGHEVTTVAMAHRFFPYTYDYDQYRFPESVLSAKYGFARLWSFAFRRLWKASPSLHSAIEKRLRIQAARAADVYVRIWGKIPFDEEVMEAIEGDEVRVATFLMGSDVRDYDVFATQYGVSRWKVPSDRLTPVFADKLHTLRTHERFGDAIFSVPDQMGLALRPYHHLQIPLLMNRFQFHVPNRAVPLVVHAPSSPQVKGTDVIEDALATLRAEGVAFEFLSLCELPHRDLLDVLSNADVVVDELILHGPGWLSFEAMASGCAVATRYLGDSPPCFRPPVWAIDEHNIIDRLRILLTDRELRIRLATEGRRYVELNNSIERVTEMMLEKVDAGLSAPADHIPDYLLTSYLPRDANEAQCINAANALVAGESWYRDRVAGQTRAGLVF